MNIYNTDFANSALNESEHFFTMPGFKNPREVTKQIDSERSVQCFSANALTRQVRLFKTHFPGDVAYAVKANPSELVIKAASLAGINTFDVASISEIERVTKIAPGANLHYHNPVKSRREIFSACHQYKCRRFAVDDLAELLKIKQETSAINPGYIEIAVRFRLPASGNAVHDFSKKFGLAPRKAADLLKQVARFGFVPVLTFHPGSQCLEPRNWQHHISAAAQITKHAGVPLQKLNVGGGFPVNYAAQKAPNLSLFFKTIETAVKKHFFWQDTPLIECEPGRAIVAPTISLLTSVKLVRQNLKEVFLNDGVYGNLMEGWQFPQLQPQTNLIRNGQYHSNNQQSYTVYGPTCDPLDQLPGQTMLPSDIAEGDFIEFKNLGAYSCATSTRFNGYGQTHMISVKTLT